MQFTSWDAVDHRQEGLRSDAIGNSGRVQEVVEYTSRRLRGIVEQLDVDKGLRRYGQLLVSLRHVVGRLTIPW